MYSYSKRIRLKSRKDYLRLSESGQKYISKTFILLVSSVLQNTPRYGITVSKRVGNAVIRNRIKRYVREFIRQSLKGITPFDYVIIARSFAASLTYKEVSNELEKLIAKSDRCSLES